MSVYSGHPIFPSSEFNDWSHVNSPGRVRMTKFFAALIKSKLTDS